MQRSSISSAASSVLFNPDNYVEQFNDSGENRSNVLLASLRDAITTDSPQVIENILQMSPDLINKPLNIKGQTPISYALSKDVPNPAVITLLLRAGANKNYLDHQGLSPKDYACFAGNEQIYNLLCNENVRIDRRESAERTLLEKLERRINNYKKESIHYIDAVKMGILDLALAQLRRIELEEYKNDKLLDLYFTVNSVFLLCRSNMDLTEGINRFLQQRENILKGDTHDYCYSLSLANQFCCQLVETLFPNEKHPLNILLQHAKTQGRKEPWQNLSTLESDLESPGSYFRTNANEIHTYEQVIHRAFANLKSGYKEPSDIWYGNDPKNVNALSRENLSILKQRSPTLTTLIDYTIELSNIAEVTVLDRFSNLRKGFLQGDFNHMGTDPEAGSPAHIALAEFLNWWNSLDKSLNGRNLKSAIRAIDNNFTAHIDEITRSNYYCVQGFGTTLENFLSRPTINASLRSLSSSSVFYTHSELDQMRNKITKELENFHPIETNRDLFKELSLSKPFMNHCLKHGDNMDFNSLENPYLNVRSDKHALKVHAFFSRMKNKIVDKTHDVKHRLGRHK